MISNKDISVVVQGAIDKKLTPECLKSIRKYFPEAEIILSTWEGSDVSGLDYDILLLNQDPGGYKHDFAIYNEPRSINNCNRQLVSTKNGILKSNRTYCLKLRSDIVLKNSGFLEYWDKFEIRNSEYKLFNHRILCSSLFSREHSCQFGTGFPTPFHPTDFWFFGLTNDLKDYFCDCPLQTKEEASNWDFKYPNRLPYTSMLWRFAPEQFFCVNWIKKYYPDLQFEDWSDWNPKNIELSNNILYNNFIFLEFKQSGIYSQKHSWSFENSDKLQGLITYEHFQKQYKKYCNKNYIIKHKPKNYKAKLNNHFERLIIPFRNIRTWFSEIFSVMYYVVIVAFTYWWNNDD